jgi:hypothetical protein
VTVPTRARRAAQLLLVAAAAFAVTLGPAALAIELVQGGSPTHDFLAPTETYDVRCTEGEPGTGSVCRTDNSTVTWHLVTTGELALEPADRDTVTAGLSQNYDGPTDLDFSYADTPSYTGETETDFVYEEGSLPDGYVGYTWCDDSGRDYTCDQTYIRIVDDAFTPGLVCHETGHAVGLVHGARTTSQYGDQDLVHLGCMVKNGVPATATLRPTQIADIDSVY